MLYRIVRFFSKKKEKESDLSLAATGAGSYLFYKKGRPAIGKAFIKRHGNAVSGRFLENEANIGSRIIEESNKRGVPVLEAPKGSSYYEHNTATDKIRTAREKIEKLAKKAKLPKEQASEYLKQIDNIKVDPNKIYINSKFGVSDLAHEFGHMHYYNDKNAGFIGKTAHVHRPEDFLIRKHTKKKLSAIGLTGGYLAEKYKHDNNGKENKVLSNSGWAIPTILRTPQLIREASASYYGHKTLKRLGADKKLLSKYRKGVIPAFGTYVTAAGADAILGHGMNKLGRLLYRKTHKDDEKS